MGKEDYYSIKINGILGDEYYVNVVADNLNIDNIEITKK